MITSRSEFSNRPAVESRFLPHNFNLDNLRVSGWYAPFGDLINGPEKFKLYHLFVVAPNPDLYATQLAFGTTYKVITPSAIEGDEPIVEDEIIKDHNNNIVYTARRVAADINENEGPDTDLGELFISVDDNKYDTMRFITNDTINEEVHPLEDDSNEEKDIVLDEDIIQITNRSAIFSRSYYEGTWSQWTIWSDGYKENTGGDGSSCSGCNIDLNRLYTYVDNRLRFDSKYDGVMSYGMKVEITGTYNAAPYDPSANVYGVSASGIEYDGLGDFPEVGNPTMLYIAKSENKLYRWDDTEGSYYCVGSDYREIFSILSGNSITILPPPEISDNNASD